MPDVNGAVPPNGSERFLLVQQCDPDRCQLFQENRQSREQYTRIDHHRIIRGHAAKRFRTKDLKWNLIEPSLTRLVDGLQTPPPCLDLQPYIRPGIDSQVLFQPSCGLQPNTPHPIGLIQRRLDTAVSFLRLTDRQQAEEQFVEYGLAFLCSQRR